MEEKTLPADFNPFYAGYALLAITDCLVELLDDIPSDEQEKMEYYDKLTGLAYAGKFFAGRLNAYLNQIDEAGYRIPQTPKDIHRVEEPLAIYAVER